MLPRLVYQFNKQKTHQNPKLYRSTIRESTDSANQDSTHLTDNADLLSAGLPMRLQSSIFADTSHWRAWTRRGTLFAKFWLARDSRRTRARQFKTTTMSQKRLVPASGHRCKGQGTRVVRRQQSKVKRDCEEQRHVCEQQHGLPRCHWGSHWQDRTAFQLHRSPREEFKITFSSIHATFVWVPPPQRLS